MIKNYNSSKSKMKLTILPFFASILLQLVIINAYGQTSVPPQPGPISGPDKVCVSTNNLVYSVPAVQGATSYLWTLPTGITGISNTNSISLSFSSTFPGGTICVTALNSLGNSANRCLQITRLNSPPNTPASITQICQGNIRTYTIAPVTNATSYTWTVPTNGQILSGQGTTSITVQNLTSTGTVSVFASNCKGNSSSRLLNISSTISTPSTITGNINSSCAGSTQTFTATTVTGASSYVWTPPTNSTIISGNGTNAVTIAFGTNFTSGNLSVAASNGCTTSAPRTTLVRSVPPNMPGVTGQLDNLCNGGSFTYTAAAPFATGYNWIVPNGYQITSQTNNSITLNIPANSPYGQLIVSGTNACGQGPSNLKGMSPLSNGTLPNGPTTVCRNSPIQTYTVSVPTGCTIQWVTSVPIVSATLNSITLNFATASSYNSLYAYAINSCGGSAGRNIDIQVNNCSSARFGEDVDSTVEEDVYSQSIVFPNPSIGTYTINRSENTDINLVQVFSISGEIVRQFNVSDSNENILIDIQDQPNGIYLLKVNSSDSSKNFRLIKQ